ncbi:MAG: hypothetical protein ACAH22_05805 [Tardiphaga sp.]
MQSRFGFSAIVVASLLASTAFASAQGAGTDGVTGAPVTQMPSPNVSPPPATGTTGMGGGTSQPGAPNTTTPGRIGTGASPSGLPGDNPNAPGFPGKVGR